MKRRIFAIFLLLALLCTALVGCGDPEPDYNGGSGMKEDVVVDGAVPGGKVVSTYRYNMETRTFNEAVTALESAVVAASGYITSSTVTPPEEYVLGSAYYEVGIPYDGAGAFETVLRDLAHVVRRQASSQDVTLTHADITARVESLEAEEVRLRELYAAASTTADLLSIEGRLTEVSSELSSLRAQLTVLENRIQYATFYIYLDEVEVYEEEEETGFLRSLWETLLFSFDFFLSIIKGILHIFVFFLPLLVVAGAVLLTVILCVRRGRKKREAAGKQDGTSESGGGDRP